MFSLPRIQYLYNLIRIFPFDCDPGRGQDQAVFLFMDYRTFYEQKTKRKLPSGWDVHHIDFNRENNEIENLLAIPKHIHILYHKIHRQEACCFHVHTLDLKPTYQNIDLGFYRMHLDSVKKIAAVLDSMFIYCQYKEFLLGNYPSIMEHLY